MQHTITTIYCLCDDFLQAMNDTDDPQTQVSSAKVMSVSLVAACYFGGKAERAQGFLHEHGYLPKRLSPSRLHALPLSLWQGLFELLGLLFKENNSGNAYTVDSMPLPACDNPPKGHPASGAASCSRVRSIAATQRAKGAPSLA